MNRWKALFEVPSEYGTVIEGLGTRKVKWSLGSSEGALQYAVFILPGGLSATLPSLLLRPKGTAP